MMKRLLSLVLIAAALAYIQFPAKADDYPTKPIRVLIGYPPGGGTDVTGRLLAEIMSTHLGQRIVVENKPGAGSTLAAGDVSNAAPDGYTLLWVGGDTITIQPALKKNLPFQVPNGFTYIFKAMQTYNLVTTGANAPFKTLAELISYAKANPGKVRYGSPGVGTSPHMGTLLLEQQAGIKMTHVPYRGSAPATVDTISGVIDLTYQTFASVGDHAKTGKLKLLAITSDTRDPSLPDVPTLAESGYPNATLMNWFALLGPPNLPADVVSRLRKAGEEAMQDKTLLERIVAQGFKPAFLYGDQFQKAIVDDVAKWKAIVTSANVQVSE
jgi:tripartite-type tricarboxylate transporter receptor subunit TctC